MNKFQTFNEFIANQNIEMSVSGFVINILITAALAFILSLVYRRFGTTLSNRKMFAANFILLATTTMLIISIVKSSLALSLGLVGALSIVRFRAAIKEPEELAYLFLNIAIGLGLGANQRIITLLAFVIIVALIILKNFKRIKVQRQNLFLTLSSEGDNLPESSAVIQVLSKYCSTVKLKRIDESKDRFEMAFLVEFSDIEKLEAGKKELLALNDSLRVSFLDNKVIA